MSRKVVVLGCGMVGATMVRDLAEDSTLSVLAVDADADRLAAVAEHPRVETLQADLRSAKKLASVIQDADLVMGALPGGMGLAALETVIRAKKPYCDISFMSEDAWDLDGLAIEHGVTAVVDCGLAPGLSNLIAAHACRALDHAERVEIYAGGLPKVRQWPYEYKAPFSPADVIEEYTRPARLVEHGTVVIKPALSEVELIDFPEVGTLEAFNTDGLRSLIKNLDVKHMKEKTLRYPGHAHLMRVLRDTGFFEKIHINIDGAKIRPIDLTSRLLFPLWAFEEDEEEFVLLRVVVEGRQGGTIVRHTYHLYDEYDMDTGNSAMARTTAFPAAIVGRMLLAGDFPEPGVFPPERLVTAKPDLLDTITESLAARGVSIDSEISQMTTSDG